ncbi:aminoglycoside phosphotransferase family protein [Nonomuraea longicatena]|uniref:Phosphotransferase n=1 Tax=Nonomuraea longicatena TaxID=83682 RepID=A0ABN1R9V4_9ACTN
MKLNDYARVMGREATGLRLVRGEGADVVLDATDGLAWRFSRHGEEVSGLAALTRLARAHGLPAPEVVEERAGCLVTRLVEGAPLEPGVEVTADALAGLLDRLATVPVDRDDDAWRSEWAALAVDVEEKVAPLLAPAQRERAMLEVRRAAEAASKPPTGFTHGDLGGANVLVADGAVSGVLDWGTAGPGDPAVDFAALSVSVSAPVRAELSARFPHLAARADAYAATFALQEALYGLRHDDRDAVEAGLAPYRQNAG